MRLGIHQPAAAATVSRFVPADRCWRAMQFRRDGIVFGFRFDPLLLTIFSVFTFSRFSRVVILVSREFDNYC